MSQHPALMQVLAGDRAAELRRTAELTALGRSRPGRHRPAVSAARNATGWFLVGVGLRLAATRPTGQVRRAV